MSSQVKSQEQVRRSGKPSPRFGPAGNHARVVWGLLGGLLAASSSPAQEALRASLASAQAAESRRQAVTQIGYYNLRWGDMTWRFGAGLGTEFNSNVNLSETEAQADLIVSPSVSLDMFWPVTQKNALNLSLGLGYSLYLEQTTLNRFYLNPGTQLGMDFYIGDFTFNLHDRPSMNQYAYQDPSVSGTGDYAQFENTIGVSGLWDLNQGVLSFGYDHNNYLSLTSQTQTRDGSSDLFYVSGGVDVLPGIQLGVEGGAGLIRYADVTSPDALQWNVGGYTQFQASQYLGFRMNVGYTVYNPEDAGLFALLESTTLVYADLALTHRLNRHVSYRLSGGRSVNISFYGQAYESYYADLSVGWKLLQKLDISTPFRWEQGTDLYGSPSTFNQYQTGIQFSRQLMEKLNGSVGYRRVVRLTEARGGDYVVNSVSLSLNYRF